MNNTISNTKTEVPTGMELNDKDYITSLLSDLKDLEKNYTVALTEASNEVLYDRIYSMFKKISKLQREVYETMFRNGWYQLEKAEETKITEKLDMLTTEYNDLDQ